MEPKYTINMRTIHNPNGINDIQIKTKKKKAFFDVLPDPILSRYRELGIDIDRVDENGDVTYWTPGKSQITLYEMDLEFVLQEKGFHIKQLNMDSEKYFLNLEKKLIAKYGESVRNNNYLWEAIPRPEGILNEILVLEEKIKSSTEVILFFGTHLKQHHLPVFNYVFKIKSFQYKPLRNYQWLTEFDDFNSPFEYVTKYKESYVSNECFISDVDLTWVFCFNHEGYFRYTEL